MTSFSCSSLSTSSNVATGILLYPCCPSVNGKQHACHIIWNDVSQILLITALTIALTKKKKTTLVALIWGWWLIEGGIWSREYSTRVIKIRLYCWYLYYIHMYILTRAHALPLRKSWKLVTHCSKWMKQVISFLTSVDVRIQRGPYAIAFLLKGMHIYN